MIGGTLDHYRIESKLGQGGMGVVYKARDTRLDRAVAIKVLPPDLVASDARKQRFVQEAKAASALNHPNIVTIHEIDAEGGVDFIVMEYVEGRTLDELMTPRGMAVAEVLKYSVPIADALSTAHRAGIVHRDVKPSNVIVTRDGRVKVLDFGLAKLIESADAVAEGPTRSRLTEVGAVMGTAAYMSPEQAEGRQVDGRSDIFSFGAVMYEMVTGRKPFAGDSSAAILAKILRDDPAPIVESIPPDLTKIIERCLRKDPARRFQSMADLKVALEDVAHAFVPARPTLTKRRSPIWLLLLLLLVAGGWFGWRVSRPPDNQEPEQRIAVTTLPGIEDFPSLSPEGSQVTFMWTAPKPNNPDIYVQLIGAGDPLPLTTDPRSDYNPVWSPDGRSIAFMRADRLPPISAPAGKAEVWLIPALGGTERKLADVQISIIGNPGFLAWSTDSRTLIVTDSPAEGGPAALFAVSLETGEKRQLTHPPRYVHGDANPAVSPDGRWLAFRRGISAMGELYLLPLTNDLAAGGTPRRLTDSGAYPAWMPDGQEIVFARPEGLFRLAISGTAKPTQVPFVDEGSTMPTVARTQPGHAVRLVYVRRSNDTDLWRVETAAPGVPASGAPAVAIASTGPDVVPSFSPDGGRVAFVSRRSGVRAQIWLANPDGSKAEPLTALDSGMVGAPRWSPDGKLIAFQSNTEGQFEIYVIPSGGGKPRNLTAHSGNDHVPTFSRDGQWIYFGSDRTKTYQVWKIPVSGGEAKQVTQNGGFLALEDKSGAQLYYSEAPGDDTAVWRVATSGGAPSKVLDGVSNGFAVHERGLYYVDRLSDLRRLGFFDFATGKSLTVANDLGDVVPLLAVSPDGRTILYSRREIFVSDLAMIENFR